MLVCTLFVMHIAREKAGARPHPVFPAPLVPRNLPECDNGRFSTNRPCGEEPVLRPKATSLSTEQGDSLRCLPQPNSARLEPDRQGRGVDDDTKRSGCRRDRCAKDKVDACIPDRNGAEDLPTTASGATQFDCMARKIRSEGGW